MITRTAETVAANRSVRMIACQFIFQSFSAMVRIRINIESISCEDFLTSTAGEKIHESVRHLWRSALLQDNDTLGQALGDLRRNLPEAALLLKLRRLRQRQ